MSADNLKFNVYTLQPKANSTGDGRADVPANELPDELAGYSRQTQDLIVTATDEGDIVVGMGGAWVYAHPEKPSMLWVKAAEVNEPFRNIGLERRLVEVLLAFAADNGISRACFAEHVRQHLSR